MKKVYLKQETFFWIVLKDRLWSIDYKITPSTPRSSDGGTNVSHSTVSQQFLPGPFDEVGQVIE